MSTDLQRYVIFRAVTGSVAHGLSQPESDVDRRGFYLPPARLHWSLDGVPEQIETAHEECYWEIGKFIRLALKSNPNVLECLYSPFVETCTPLAAELAARRHIFLSKLAYGTYNAYVDSQFRKIARDLGQQRQPRWKHVVHLIRLLLSGISVLRDGTVPVHVGEHRDRLLAIRGGGIPWEQIDQWRLALHREMEAAAVSAKLPDAPAVSEANDYLLRARRFAAREDYEQ